MVDQIDLNRLIDMLMLVHQELVELLKLFVLELGVSLRLLVESAHLGYFGVTTTQRLSLQRVYDVICMVHCFNCNSLIAATYLRHFLYFQFSCFLRLDLVISFCSLRFLSSPFKQSRLCYTLKPI